MKKGFTLIELLIVIAIIGILTAFITINLTKSKSKARDNKRKSDIRAIQMAVEMYYSEKGKYPEVDETGLGNVLVPKYLPSMPKDPLDGKVMENAPGQYYGYHYWPSAICRGKIDPGTGYAIIAGTENPTSSEERVADWRWADQGYGKYYIGVCK